MTLQVDHLMFDQWPASRPRPTPEEGEAARGRYHAELRAALDAYRRGEGPLDDTDWPAGLSFVMATYNPLLWLKYFFPAEEEKFKEALKLQFSYGLEQSGIKIG